MPAITTGAFLADPCAWVLELDFLRPESTMPGSLALAHSSELPASLEALDSILHGNEIAEFRSLAYSQRRSSFLLGRLAAKRAACRLLPGIAFPDIEIVKGVFEQPLLEVAGRLVPDISISHSGALAMALVFRREQIMGVDLESLDPARDGVFRNQASLREKMNLATLSLDADRYCPVLWTMKESLSKALKCGLMAPIELYAIGEITRRDGWLEATFLHFHQFKAIGVLAGNYAFSMVVPKRTSVSMDRENLVRCLETVSRRAEPVRPGPVFRRADG